MGVNTRTDIESQPPARKRPFQFGLKHLLGFTAWLALLFSSIAWLGAVGGLLYLLLSCVIFLLLVRSPADARFPFRLQYLAAVPLWPVLLFVCLAAGEVGAFLFFLLLGTAIAICVVCLVIGLRFRSAQWIVAAIGWVSFLLLLPTVFGASPGGVRRTMCTNNLKQIALALRSYHDAHGSFPPAYVADENGRPMHSWRVLILPYLGQQALYDQYRFDEPWDGPNNRKLAEIPLDGFNCPSEEHETPSTMTSYVAVVGPDTAWPEGKSTKLDDITDGPSNTLLVVEVKDSGIHWMEPRDLHVVQMAPRVNPKSGQGISSQHPGGANVAMADGYVLFLSEDTSPELLRAMRTIAGADETDGEDPSGRN